MKKLVTLAIISLLWNQYIIAQNVGDNHQDLKEVDLIIQADKIKIGGTLTLPATFNTSSLVIMSSGSGPQDRDETLDGFKIFKVIADHLATKGIASFRYDDRGVGSSTGDFVNSTIEDHTKDLEHVMSYFKSSEKHTFNEFILFGHSQGGILSSKVAVKNESVKGLVLMSTPAVPLIEIVTYQIRQEYSQTNISQSLIEADVSAHNRLLRAIADDKAIEDAYQLFRQTTETILYEMNSESNIDSIIINQKAITKADEFKIIYKLPSLTSFLYYDPFKDLENLSIPVLSLFGGLDFQVPIELNKDRMENALLKSGTEYQFFILEKANHFFQKAKTGYRDEYATLEKKFVNNFLNKISYWILDH